MVNPLLRVINHGTNVPRARAKVEGAASEPSRAPGDTDTARAESRGSSHGHQLAIGHWIRKKIVAALPKRRNQEQKDLDQATKAAKILSTKSGKEEEASRKFEDAMQKKIDATNRKKPFPIDLSSVALGSASLEDLEARYIRQGNASENTVEEIPQMTERGLHKKIRSISIVGWNHWHFLISTKNTCLP